MNTLTCVYCGMAYPEGTPPHGAQILTEHIKVCEKHPLRAAEAKIAKLREALIFLVGESRKEKLEEMIHQIDNMPGVSDYDRISTIKAMRVLIETSKD